MAMKIDQKLSSCLLPSAIILSSNKIQTRTKANIPKPYILISNLVHKLISKPTPELIPELIPKLASYFHFEFLS
jgi:hypothetical protein